MSRAAARFVLGATFCLAFSLVSAVPAAAQEIRARKTQEAAAPVLADEPAVFAIVGATVHTMGDGGVMEDATVVVRGERVEAVGYDLEIPAGASVLDARGKVLTPGFFDSSSRIGLVEVGAVRSSRDMSTEDDRMTAAFRVADAVNPASSVIPVVRVEGLTRALVLPSPGSSVIAGQGALIHLGSEPGDGPGAILVREPAAMYAAFGERGAGLSGGARGAALLRLREALDDARDFAANRAAYDRGERRGYALSRLDLEALAPVVAGDLPLVISANRASDVLALLRLGSDHPDLDLVIAGAAEGWLVADELAAAGVPVLLNALANLPSSFETLGATLANAARLHRAGVTFAFMSGSAHGAANLRQDAGNAVAHGLPWEAALAAMTTAPAEIWGIADTYGKIAPGYDADLVVWDGDPLELTSYPDHVFIRGEEMPKESRQLLLRDRYLDLPEEGERSPAYRRP